MDEEGVEAQDPPTLLDLFLEAERRVKFWVLRRGNHSDPRKLLSVILWMEQHGGGTDKKWIVSLYYCN